MSALAVEMRGVALSLRGETVLEDLDFELARGDYIALLGPNGCGKTSLLKIILGLLRPDRGVVRVLGKAPEEVRGRVGYVPQHARFDRDFPVRVVDVVRMGTVSMRRRRAGSPLSGRTDFDIARAALERVEMPALADRPIGSLSGGELQRVLIARALALEPELLLLDEPTASLDLAVTRAHYELLASLSRDMTIVLVSHDIGAVSSHVRRVACLRKNLHIHESAELTSEILMRTWGCPVHLLVHDHEGGRPGSTSFPEEGGPDD
jgi:zinc transport system ATP-binding protein